MMKKLSNLVNSSIYNYPSLYRVEKNPDLSRKLVLHHLFFVNGNGYEWHPDGYLYSYDTKKKVNLPKDYFDKELYYADIVPENVESFEKELKDRYHYTLEKNKRYVRFVFEANKELANNLYIKYSTETICSEAYEARHYSIQHKISDLTSFYPSSEYSCFMELMNGKDAMSGITFTPKQDWLEGCIEIVVDALDYYENRKRYQYHSYCPNKDRNPAMTMTKKKWEEYRKKEIEVCLKFLKHFNVEV